VAETLVADVVIADHDEVGDGNVMITATGTAVKLGCTAWVGRVRRSAAVIPRPEAALRG
jgi:S-adenosylmethionine synthetase